MTANTIAWPQDVTARYLTVGGATVDVTNNVTDDHGWPDADCTGCPQTFRENSRYLSGGLDTVHKWANEHATTCRALPRPGGDA